MTPSPYSDHHQASDPTAAEAEGAQSPTGYRRFVALAALAVWMPAVALGLGSLMVGHWAPLPQPESESGSVLAQGLQQLVNPRAGLIRLTTTEDTSKNWTMVHVLYEGCGCSQRVVDYLMGPRRSSHSGEYPLDEWVILVGDDSDSTANGDSLASAAAAAGYLIKRETQTSLFELYGIESAPLFVVLNPTSEPAFVGGYTARKQGLAYEDLHVLEQLQQGAQPAPIPIYGCGVSTSLQTALDPFSIKYP